jgi:peptidoglycan/LPS O-acetylase OafA/YrhL
MKAYQDSNLDILRAVAVLAVLVAHSLESIAHVSAGGLGRIGLLLFFVHTSLVLMLSLERSSASVSTRKLVKQFYIRRAFRIYPLSVALVLMSVALSIPQGNDKASYQWQGTSWVISNLLLVQNITGHESVSGVLWSLPFEVQMYLVLPFLFLALRTRFKWAALVLAYALGFYLSLAFQPCMFMACFMGGVIAYSLKDTQPFIRAGLWFPVIIVFTTMFALAPGSFDWTKNFGVSLVLGLFIHLFHRQQGLIATASAYIAKYSYGIYLSHAPLLWLFCRKFSIPEWQQVFGVLISVAVVSVICYHTVEHPLIVVGSRLAKTSLSRIRHPLAAHSRA